MIWHDVCARRDIPPERGWPVSVDGQPVAVFCVGATLHALSNVCLHVGSPIDDGFVAHGCVTCPWHGWRYELVSGHLLTTFGHRPGLRTYPVREVDGRVLIGTDD
ncbi:MAG: Rieske 2Fe-2S domain-containing protein [Actinomycetota bacterium]|nr:Rieske 2Fe-2S domain-containing protein [Actinomycetota bacterium]